MELDPDVDLTINVSDLTTEFRNFPIVMYRYSQKRASAEATRDLAEATLKELRAIAYKRVKSDLSAKHTEKGLESEIETDPDVKTAKIKLIQAEHNAATWAGAVESMRSKKDCLIQLVSDRRKEM